MSKVWFITGSSRGFGREFALAALKRGDQVAATARDTKTLTDLVERFGDAVLPLRVDVTDRAQVFEVVAAAKERFGRARRAQPARRPIPHRLLRDGGALGRLGVTTR